MRLSNVKQLVTQDFKPEDQELIERLGGVLNFFMRQVVELSNENIDFENMTWDIVTVRLTVDSSGIPIRTTRFTSTSGNPRGLSVIRAVNRTNRSNFVTNHPFTRFTYQGNDLIKIDQVTGLIAGEEYDLSLVVY